MHASTPFASHWRSSSSGKKSRLNSDIASVIQGSRTASYLQKCWCESMVICRLAALMAVSATIKIVRFRQVSQSRSSTLRGDIALRPSEQLITHHEFLHSGGSQQWWKIMCVEMELRMTLAIRRLLMKPHRIREGRLEQIVVADCQSSEDVRETPLFGVVQHPEARHMPAAQDHRFERPYGPIRHKRHESIVLANNPLPVLDFQTQVLTQHAFLSDLQKIPHACTLSPRH